MSHVGIQEKTMQCTEDRGLLTCSGNREPSGNEKGVIRLRADVKGLLGFSKEYHGELCRVLSRGWPDLASVTTGITLTCCKQTGALRGGEGQEWKQVHLLRSYHKNLCKIFGLKVTAVEMIRKCRVSTFPRFCHFPYKVFPFSQLKDYFID